MKIGAFEVGIEIGRGGMGAVYVAKHESDKVDVALKVLGDMQPEMEHTFDLEVQAMARLNHPNIAMVVDAGRLEEEASKNLKVVPNAPWIAMEFISGDELAKLRGELEWDEIRDFTLGILDALAHSHSLGVVHRDIKPQNIIIERTPDGRVAPKLVDFGIALPIEELETQGGDPTDHTVIGTPRYIAPEQVAAAWSIQGPPTDLYSLACVVWELTTGKPPFKGSSYVVMLSHLNDPPGNFIPTMDVPPGLEGWLRRLLNKQPMERYRRAADAAYALRQLGDVFGYDDDEPTEVEDDGDTIKMPAFEMPVEAPAQGWRSTYDRPPIPPAARELDTSSRVTLVGSGLGLVGLRNMPMVGRQKEREALWQALIDADKTGKPQPVVLRGPAGVGKSRLAEWFSRHADEVGGAQVLRVIHSENGGATDGLGPAITRHLRCKGLNRPQASEFVQKWLSDRMTRPPRGLIESLFSIVTAGYGEVNTSAFVMEPTERYRIFIDLLEVFCMERPVVLWIDDAQWGRDAVELGHQLMAQDLPVVMVLTLKDDAVETPSTKRVVELGEKGKLLQLHPLTEDEQISLVRQMLGLSLSLASTVAQRTGGNPLFATQLVRSWVASEALIPSDDGLVLSSDAASVPDDVHVLLAHDFERIMEPFIHRAPTAPAIVELAALLGNEITDAELDALGVDAYLADEVMRALAFGGYVERTEDGWYFSASLFRESLERRAQDGGRAAEHHRRCAEMLADRYDDQAVGIAARRARHLLGAGEYEQAIPPLLMAAELAVEESVAEAQALLNLLDTAIENVHGDTQRARVKGKLIQGSIELIGGHVDEVLAISAEVADVAENNGWTYELGRALSQRANVLLHQGKPAEALDAYEQTLAVIEGEGSLELARVLVSLGIARRRANNVGGAIEACARAVEIYESLDREYDLVKARSELGCSMLGHGRYDEARELLKQAGKDAASMGSTNAQWRALLLEGLLEILAEHWEPARACFRQAREVFDVEGIPKTVVEMHEAFIEACDGDVAQAEETLNRAVEMFEKTGLKFELPSVQTALGICAARRGDWEAFDTLIQQAHEGISQSGATSLLVAAGGDAAADFAREAGQTDQEEKARELAQSQWDALGHPRAN